MLGIGMVGYAFMGAAHSQAWRTVSRVFDLPLSPVMVALCGRDAAAAERAAATLGWQSSGTDWRELVERPDIDVIDICTPTDTHAEIAIAALEAGKHVLCEKPLANTVEEAEAMAAAAERARARGVRSMVGFNYRRVPAVTLARALVQEEHAGSGALGDIGAHIVDLAQFMVGERLTGVSGLTETFVKERPLASHSSGLAATGRQERGPVTVDDAALFIGRFSGGAVASFEATRFATGRKNALRIEINGSAGSLAFDFEAMNELYFYDGTDDPLTAGFRQILVTEPAHPYLSAWWPPGHLLGYEHTFTHEIRDLVVAIGAYEDPVPSFRDGLQVQQALEAVELSAANRSCWQDIPTI